MFVVVVVVVRRSDTINEYVIRVQQRCFKRCIPPNLRNLLNFFVFTITRTESTAYTNWYEILRLNFICHIYIYERFFFPLYTSCTRVHISFYNTRGSFPVPKQIISKYLSVTMLNQNRVKRLRKIVRFTFSTICFV